MFKYVCAATERRHRSNVWAEFFVRTTTDTSSAGDGETGSTRSGALSAFDNPAEAFRLAFATPWWVGRPGATAIGLRVPMTSLNGDRESITAGCRRSRAHRSGRRVAGPPVRSQGLAALPNSADRYAAGFRITFRRNVANRSEFGGKDTTNPEFSRRWLTSPKRSGVCVSTTTLWTFASHREAARRARHSAPSISIFSDLTAEAFNSPMIRLTVVVPRAPPSASARVDSSSPSAF